MTQFTEYTRIAFLLSHYVTEIATEEEIQELKLWREACPEHEAFFCELTENNFWSAKTIANSKINISDAYAKVIKKRNRKKSFRLPYRVVTWVASLLLPLGVGLWFFLKQEVPEPPYLPSAGMKMVCDSILPGEVKAELVLSDGSTIRLDGSVQDSVTSEAGNVITAVAHGLSYAGQKETKELIYNVLSIPRGGEYSLELADGTMVYLNSETVLRYPVQFVGKERRVELTGEAYFEVAHDATKPFIVETARSWVEVLGTSFNLRSYKDEDKVATTLVKGKVCFVTDTHKEVSLDPGEQVVMDGNGRLTKKEVDTYLYTAWKDGNFVFYKQPLEEVMKVIARWYDVEIHFIDASQRNVIFTGNVKRYEDFSKIIRMLEMTGNTEFMINGKNIFIKEK